MLMKGKHTINYLQYHEYGFGRPSLEREVQLVFVFTAPVAELNAVSFTVPLNGWTFVATAAVVPSCSSLVTALTLRLFLRECLRRDVVWWWL